MADFWLQSPFGWFEASALHRIKLWCLTSKFKMNTYKNSWERLRSFNYDEKEKINLNMRYGYVSYPCTTLAVIISRIELCGICLRKIILFASIITYSNWIGTHWGLQTIKDPTYIFCNELHQLLIDAKGYGAIMRQLYVWYVIPRIP